MDSDSEFPPLERNTKDCPICGKHFRKPADVRKHLVAHRTVRSFSCQVCKKAFKASRNLKDHQLLIHTASVSFQCTFCAKILKSKKHFERHELRHTSDFVEYCDECDVGFFAKCLYKSHMAVKHDPNFEPSFQCEVCGKSFNSSGYLNYHRKAKHWDVICDQPQPTYDCKVCDKHYTSHTGLRLHNRAKHNVDNVDFSVLCDICGKRLSSKEKLKLHRRIHTGYKPYGCDVCSKSFSRKEQLKEHERVHTGERPYICGTCGKGFTQRSPLRIHERMHSGERPYICRLCGKGFISKSVMDNHMNTCTPGNNRIRDS